LDGSRGPAQRNGPGSLIIRHRQLAERQKRKKRKHKCILGSGSGGEEGASGNFQWKRMNNDRQGTDNRGKPGRKGEPSQITILKAVWSSSNCILLLSAKRKSRCGPQNVGVKNRKSCREGRILTSAAGHRENQMRDLILSKKTTVVGRDKSLRKPVDM